MKKRFYTFFDDVGEFITSRAIVIILMVPFMWYRFYEFETLFMKWLPIANPQTRTTAAKLISLVFITVTLLFMVNVKRLFKGVKVVLAATAFTLNLFFWSLAEDVHNWYFIIFISAVIASMDYGQSHLFDSQWRERAAELQTIDFRETLHKLKLDYTKVEDKLTSLRTEASDLKDFIQSHTCPYCGEVKPSIKSIAAHKGVCSHKPQIVQR